MKVAAFVGSPRRGGITDAVVRQVLRGAEDSGADTEVFNIGLLDVRGCRACMGCRESGECVQEDDMKQLFEELLNADCIVLGTPIYFYYMTAQMKAFTDRLFSLIGSGFRSRLGRKRSLLVITQGADDPGAFADQIQNMRNAWGMAGLDFCDTVLACSFEDAQAVESDAQLMEESFKAGQSLASRDI